ncbi:MAG: glycosyltransferase [Candidatus Sumerlaeaceae bacterium]|nr:glycosyltransferase [Candidatus Sumerlaeaceae bacterium]
MMKHRILRLITWLPNGGIERKILAVLPRLNPDLFEIQACCIREPGPLAPDLEAAGIPVHVIPFRSRWDPLALTKLSRLVERLEIKLIHAHMYRANTPATALGMWDKNVKIIGQYHNVNTWESSGQLRMDRWLAPKRAMNLAVSEAVRENVIKTLRLDPAKVRTVYNGVDTQEFRPVATARRHAIRERLGIPATAKLVAMVARLVKQKNQELVLRCVPDLVRATPRAHFLFLGGGPDENRLRQIAGELRIADNVTFLGNRDDIAEILPACDLSILPSRREGFSNTVLESMACGLPVVASDVGGNREVIDSGISGFLVDTIPSDDGADPQVSETQFLRYTRRLLIEDDFRIAMGANARDHVMKFSLGAMIQDVERLYLDLLEGPVA